MQHILDAHAEFAGQIDAGLCGDDGVLRQLCVRAGRGDGVLVDVEPEAVSEAVTEAVPVAASVMTLRAAASTRSPVTPAFAAAMPASCASSTVWYTVRISSLGMPTATVRVMSEQ